MVELEDKVLMILKENPDKGYTVLEILSVINEVKIPPEAYTKYYREIWDIKGVLNSLENKGLVVRSEDSSGETCFKMKK